MSMSATTAPCHLRTKRPVPLTSPRSVASTPSAAQIARQLYESGGPSVAWLFPEVDTNPRAPAVRVSPVYASVHYLACDKKGTCAAFEHIGGKQVISQGARALTNHTYAESVAWAAQQAQPPAGLGSLARYARAARQASTPPAGDPVTAAFALLDDVRAPESQWNIVYDPVHLRVSFRTKVSRDIKVLDLGKLEASCAKPVELLDIDAFTKGDVGGLLQPYDQARNRLLVERSVRKIRDQLPPGAVDMIVAYPSALACKAP